MPGIRGIRRAMSMDGRQAVAGVVRPGRHSWRGGDSAVRVVLLHSPKVAEATAHPLLLVPPPLLLVAVRASISTTTSISSCSRGSHRWCCRGSDGLSLGEALPEELASAGVGIRLWFVGSSMHLWARVVRGVRQMEVLLDASGAEVQLAQR